MSGLPTVVFITVYIVAGRDLAPALIAAVVTGSVLAIYRLIRRQRLQQVLTGFLGLAVAAGFSAWTGQAENFFLPGLITNVVYGSAFIVSILVGWPLLGVAMGYLTGDGTSWRSDKQWCTCRRFLGVGGSSFGRLMVQVPLAAVMKSWSCSIVTCGNIVLGCGLCDLPVLKAGVPGASQSRQRVCFLNRVRGPCLRYARGGFAVYHVPCGNERSCHRPQDQRRVRCFDVRTSPEQRRPGFCVLRPIIIGRAKGPTTGRLAMSSRD